MALGTPRLKLGPPVQVQRPHVYVIEAVGTPFVKIGVSVGSSDPRLRKLQTGCPYELRLVARLEVVDHVAVEAELHRRFAAQRERGEWFRREGPVDEWLAGHGG